MMSFAPASGILSLLLLLAPFSPARAADPRAATEPADDLLPLVPAGFKVELFAREPLVRNPCAIAFDSRGRLFVGQGPQYRSPKPDTPGDTVVILIDQDGDGVAETAKTFASGLNCVQGLTWHGRDLWVANSPDLTIVRDLDGDDEADEYVLVYTDLGNIEHALHGLNWAPDGKLYMSKGNSKGLTQPGRIAPKPFRELWDVTAPAGSPDFPPPRVFKKGEYRRTYHDPNDYWGRMGGILRCDDLGSNLEIVSRGYRNPFDIGFDSGFNWLGTDNDQNEGDRIFMPFFGADFGWAHKWSSHWTGEGHLPTVPLSGPVFHGSGTGILHYDTPQFPPVYRDVWFINDYQRGTTYSYRPAWAGSLLTPEGGKLSEFIRRGKALFNPVDSAVGPDGTLYISGWGSRIAAEWRNGQQINEGRIFRVAWEGATAPAWDTPQRAKPVVRWTFDELVEDLGSSVPAWRTDAQDELVRRASAVRADLIGFLEKGGLSSGQETWALWTLGRLEPNNRAIDDWFAATGHTRTFNARLQSSRIAAHRIREWQSTARLPQVVIDALSDAEPRIRFAAVQSVGQAKQTHLVDAIWALTANETDRVTFYAAWHALLEIASPSDLRAKVRDTRPGVRRAALLALLDRGVLDESEIRRLLQDPDGSTAEVAALWLAKRDGNPLIRIWPAPGEFTDAIRVYVTPGMDGVTPSYVNYTIDGSEPTPGRNKKDLILTDTATVKFALFVDGRKVGNTVVGTWRKRASSASGEVVLVPPDEPTTWTLVRPLLTVGDAKRGHGVFVAAGCVACHRVGAEGGTFGPDLSGIGEGADVKHLIRSVLEPNAEITEGFALRTITTRDGKTFAGRLHEETDNGVALMQPDGQTVWIKRADIVKNDASRISPMPSYEMVLGPKPLADLVTWLAGRRQAPPAVPAAAR
jgi:putative membrane-bound dehydrogenase-like protein